MSVLVPEVFPARDARARGDADPTQPADRDGITYRDMNEWYSDQMLPNLGAVGRAEIAQMKATSYLINTARGPIVEKEALVEALYAGRIAGAGIDVFDVEPPPLDDPLLLAPNTIVSPHAIGRTDVSYRQQAQIVVAVLKNLRNGAVTIPDGKVVNHEVLQSDLWLHRRRSGAHGYRHHQL